MANFVKWVTVIMKSEANVIQLSIINNNRKLLLLKNKHDYCEIVGLFLQYKLLSVPYIESPLVSKDLFLTHGVPYGVFSKRGSGKEVVCLYKTGNSLVWREIATTLLFRNNAANIQLLDFLPLVRGENSNFLMGKGDEIAFTAPFLGVGDIVNIRISARVSDLSSTQGASGASNSKEIIITPTSQVIVNPSNRVKLTLFNVGQETIYIGFSSAVTLASSAYDYEIPPGYLVVEEDYKGIMSAVSINSTLKVTEVYG